MKKLDIAKNIIEQSGGIVKTTELNDAGIQNYEIVRMCKEGQLERIRHGYYQLANYLELSEEKMIAAFLEEGIVCMESALFYYGYNDHTPLAWTLAVPRNIARAKLRIENFPYRVYFVQDDKLSLGKTEAVFNGVKLPVYDRERTICDCFKYKNKMDSEMFNKAVHGYVADEKKNLRNLSQYAKEMRVYNKVNELMGVMLNG